MSNEEAKAYFVMRLKDKYKYAKGYTTQKEAFEKAIEALEKQIPKKPIHDSFYYHCPICNGVVYKGRGCANNECRQAIDWSEDND